MSVKLPTKYLFLSLLVVFAGLFTLGWYLGHKRADNASAPQIGALNAKIKTYEVMLHDSKLYVAEKTQELTTLKKMIADGSIEKAELRALNLKKTHEITRLNFRIDTLLAGVSHDGDITSIIRDGMEAEDNTVPVLDQKAIKLPFTFTQKDDYLNLRGDFDANGKLDVTLGMKIPVSVITGIGKDKKPSCVVTTPNKYVTVISLESYKTDVPRIKRYGVGIQAGYGLQKDFKLTPYLGLGVSYNFIRF